MLRNASHVCVISLIISTPCFAGIYVGAAAGPEGATFRQKSHVVGANPGQPESVFNVDATNNFSGVGGFGSFFAGYAWSSNKYYCSGELNVNISSVKYTLTNNELIHHNFAKTYFKITHSEGVSILPGYFLSDTTLVYGRLGYANGRVIIDEGADPSIMSMNKNLNGFRYGVGVRHAVSAQWSLMMDYSQISYAHINSHTFDPFGVVTKDTSITPTTAQLALGVIYNFDKPNSK